MSVPHDHHYAPQFYLSGWLGSDGKLCEYSRPYGGIVKPLRKVPKATGFERHLYSVPGLPDDEAHVVESEFMQRLDTRAADALNKILRGDRSPWDTNERSALTRFILGTMLRHPQAVEVLRTQMRHLTQVAIDDLRANYNSFRLPGDPETPDEYIARMEPEAADKAALNVLQASIDNTRVGPFINRMDWKRHWLKGTKVPLLTSDRPLIMPKGPKYPDCFLLLPISPDKLFVAAHTDWYAKGLQTIDATVVARAVNREIVAQARKYVWGVDDKQLAFVQKRMATLPDRVILTEAQKEQGLATMRSERVPPATDLSP